MAVFALVLAGLAVAAAHLQQGPFMDTVGEKRMETRQANTDPFRLASSQGDGMVLQMAPAQATVWGFVPAGQEVTVDFLGHQIAATTGKWLGENTWIAKLPATQGGLTEYNITATSNGVSLTLAGALFGDVWVCSGQSNMQYPIGSPTCWNASNINCTSKGAQCSYGCVENAGAEISAMGSYSNMRLYQNTNGGSKVPMVESQNSGWKLPKDMGGGFSAMCWFFGRDLYSALAAAGKPRPIGLIETNVGGTPDEHWSSPDALDKCKNLNKPWEWPSNFTDSVLWNGKVVPLLRNTIKGGVWMQGEANAGRDGRQYNCSFQAMIQDWRQKWAESTGGTTDPAFPFGWAQLNSDAGAQLWKPDGTAPLVDADVTDPLGMWQKSFMGIRLAEESSLTLSNTFQAVILDTPVASGSIHSPYKQAAGSRLARGALATAYDIPQPYPTFGSATVQGNTATIKLSGLAGVAIELRQQFGFEVLGADKLWHSVLITASSGDSISVGNVPAGASAIRYLWYTSPCTLVPYKCPVYVKAKPLGSLSGQFDVLPLGPFIAELSKNTIMI